MTQDTPGTRPDPETPGDGDGNQLPLEDTLIDRGLADNLDEGYSPPEKPSTSLDETSAEQNEPDDIEEREDMLEAEVWELEPDETATADPNYDRTGRLYAPDEAGTGHEQDVAAVDEGRAGGSASAEEAAMHFEGEEEFDEVWELESDEVDEDDIDDPENLEGPEDLDDPEDPFIR